ncbi:MAG: hypothetical protein V2I27_00705 [Erythrobacter sp.]|nr:hypothetical protein [Erythrobacter sp.]
MKRDAVSLAAMALLFLIVSLIGFTPRYFAPMVQGTLVMPSAWMHPHAVLSLLFLTACLIQPLLIGAGSIALHRRAGIAAMIIAAGNAITGFALQIDLLPVSPLPQDAQLAAFTARFVSGLKIFVPAVILAYVYRRRSEIHARLMYLAAMSVIPSPFNRIMVEFLGIAAEAAGPLASAINVALALALPIYDRLTRGKVTATSWIALGAVLASQAVFGLLFTNSGWIALLTS